MVKEGILSHGSMKSPPGFGLWVQSSGQEAPQSRLTLQQPAGSLPSTELGGARWPVFGSSLITLPMEEGSFPAEEAP